MPNLGGPKGPARRLLAMAVRSIALYAAPVWSRDVMASPRTLAILHRVERTLAARVSCAYRTISRKAAMLLAGLPPLEIVADCHRDAYERLRTIKERGVPITDKIRSALHKQTKTLVLERWSEWTESDPSPYGAWTKDAIFPAFQEWCNRSHGSVSFHMAQLMSGHGCFGSYLYRIGREVTPECVFCQAGRDDVEHTLFACPQWEDERAVLQIMLEEVEPISELARIVSKISGDKGCWREFSRFCSAVLLQKENEERRRENEGLRVSGQRGRRRRRRQ